MPWSAASEGEQDCTGVLPSVVLQRCLAPVEALSLLVGGFPQVLSHLLAQSESVAVEGLETGCGGHHVPLTLHKMAARQGQGHS